MVKNPPANAGEIRVPTLGGKDTLEEQRTPVFLPGGSHGQRSLAGYSPWRHEESDTTEEREGKQRKHWSTDSVL